MKDAKGHGSYAHNAGIDAIPPDMAWVEKMRGIQATLRQLNQARHSAAPGSLKPQEVAFSKQWARELRQQHGKLAAERSRAAAMRVK